MRPKICSLDCVYCEARATTELTVERKEYVPVDAVIAELESVLRERPKLDFITFSGSGEPTLNSGIGRVVSFLKDNYPEYKLCLLTNGCSLGDPGVRSAIARVDRVVPSLDASCAEEFRVVNRPAPGLDFDRIIADLTKFCNETESEVFLELFIVPGVNDFPESIERFAGLIRPMHVDLVQLNTLDRPGVVDWIHPADEATVRDFIAALEPFVPVQAVGKFRYTTEHTGRMPLTPAELEERILSLVNRRPSTLADLALTLGMPEEKVFPRVQALLERNMLKAASEERGIFYSPQS